MSLAESALRRPVTVMVVVVGILLAATLALLHMPRDIFPSLGTPTIYVAQPYGGIDRHCAAQTLVVFVAWQPRLS